MWPTLPHGDILAQTAAEDLVWVHGPTAEGSVTVSMTSDTTDGHTDARSLDFNTLLMPEGRVTPGGHADLYGLRCPLPPYCDLDQGCCLGPCLGL